MAKYIDRGTAIAKLTALEVTEPNATMADAKRVLADMQTADVASNRFTMMVMILRYAIIIIGK